jgi:CRP/FNR family cyclic AMP-dependent transcriptional regulator
MAVPIDRRQLLAWIAQCPEVGAQMLRLFARWTKATTNCFIDFTFADVQSRVASRLLLLRKRFGHQEGEVVRVPRDLTWEDFSLLVGVSPETIGETLCDFEDRGWIRLEDTSVVIVDAQSLTSVRVTSMSEVRCA